MLLHKNYHINHLSFFLSVLFFLCAHVSFGQTISGSVTDNFTPLNGAIVKNISGKKAAISDGNGNFKITAGKGDTLTISFISYKTDTLMLKDQTFLAITLQPLTQLLSEVLINSNRLSPLAQFNKNQDDYKQIYRIGNNRRLISASGDYRHLGVGLNIDALYSTFSKEGRDARRLQRVFVNHYHNDIVDSRFNKTLVSRITGYKGKQLEDFMADNRPSYSFIESATDYDLIQFIQRCIHGVVLQADNPAAKKTNKEGFKIIYKMPKMKTASGLDIR